MSTTETEQAHDDHGGSFTSIPILDLSLASSSSNPKDKLHLLSQLRHALTEIGFLYIKNHSVPTPLVSDLVKILPVVFSLPLETKVADLGLVNSPHFLGYSSVGDETTAGRTDSREQFEFATELPARPLHFGLYKNNDSGSEEEGGPLYERLKGPNQWPDESKHPQLAGFRAILERYMAEMTALGERFLRLVAEALDLSGETFFPFLSEQLRLKLVRYPPANTSFPKLPNPDTGEQQEHSGLNDERREDIIQGVGSHKDSSGWWTFLLQASPPHIKGLQVLNKSGHWIDVPVLKDTFVVNIGQAFEVVTNGVCKATTHRVVLSSHQKEERFSVPFFQGVRGDLTKEEAVGTLREHFERWGNRNGVSEGREAREGREIDSAFLKGRYDTWGESQLRTKIRSHRDVGRRWYPDVFDKYIGDDL